MNKINASIVIPSHRSDTSTVRRLISTIDLFLQHGFEVVLADNSGSVSKSERLHREFAQEIIFAQTEVDCNASDNFLAGFAATTGKYVLFVSDDDIFLPAGVKELAEAIDNSSNNHGFCASVTHHSPNSTTIAAPPNLTSPSAAEHLVGWASCDTAVSFYGCYSQTIWQRYFRFINQHPVKFAHHDQLLRFFIADVGNIVCLNSAWMAYDRSNWSDGQSAYHSLERFYLKAGFDGRMYYAEPLWEAIEGIFCQFKLDELAGRKTEQAFIPYWWGLRFDIWQNSLAANQHAMPIEVWQLLEPLVNYLAAPKSIDAYQILQLLSNFMVGLYGHDGGLQQFWLHQATASLKAPH